MIRLLVHQQDVAQPINQLPLRHGRRAEIDVLDSSYHLLKNKVHFGRLPRPFRTPPQMLTGNTVRRSRSTLWLF